jgi:predicted transcriptional regulator
MSLNKTLIEPLRDWRFITETKNGTDHIISLTEDGKHALDFLSADIENT